MGGVDRPNINMKIGKICKHLPEDISVEIVRAYANKRGETIVDVDTESGFKRLYTPREIITNSNLCDLTVLIVTPIDRRLIKILVL